MKRKTGSQSKEGEQANKQQTQPMQGPEAASKRDVQEAEKKAERARSQLQEARDEFEQRVEELEQKIDEFDTMIDVVDEQLEVFAENVKTRGFGNSLEKEMGIREAVQKRQDSDGGE